MRYTPCSLVTAVRAPPMRLGLVTDTVTPGSVAPLESVARPVIVPVCSCASAPRANTPTSIRARHAILRDLNCIASLLPETTRQYGWWTTVLTGRNLTASLHPYRGRL